uniref:Uncharacterized protein n=1 Tax=Picea glauca TaxID=3330 RepID=A0A101LWV9_PICGL|nr:hypothetical protein ABT39_MTgene6297 [Picea glauca]QHR88002.1 hypothetical protein Q903MT_gene2014 [Picea sitchensis]
MILRVQSFGSTGPKVTRKYPTLGAVGPERAEKGYPTKVPTSFFPKSTLYSCPLLVRHRHFHPAPGPPSAVDAPE